METKIGILSLPTELILDISQYLNYPSIVALRLSCRHLNITIAQPAKYTMADLLEIEQWPAYHHVKYRDGGTKQPYAEVDYFACYICLKIKQAINFSNAMMRGKKGKLSDVLAPDRHGRFCIPCGISTGSYIRGSSFYYGGYGVRQGMVCVDCGLFKDKPWNANANVRRCEECLARYQARLTMPRFNPRFFGRAAGSWRTWR
ncbi:hypothetical protein TWF694_010119 [Orbilia ellipsospora]|uniref:F-box domain-containing protein n=1 Tax=Orbilia ellipsospora TaxID=2528407 RepID=A0AAV9X8X6_9PEZI